MVVSLSRNHLGRTHERSVISGSKQRFSTAFCIQNGRDRMAIAFLPHSSSSTHAYRTFLSSRSIVARFGLISPRAGGLEGRKLALTHYARVRL